MSNQKQPVTGPALNKDYQPLLDRLLRLMREQMGERLLGLDLKARLLPSAEEESPSQRQEKE